MNKITSTIIIGLALVVTLTTGIIVATAVDFFSNLDISLDSQLRDTLITTDPRTNFQDADITPLICNSSECKFKIVKRYLNTTSNETIGIIDKEIRIPATYKETINNGTDNITVLRTYSDTQLKTNQQEMIREILEKIAGAKLLRDNPISTREVRAETTLNIR